MFGFTSEKEFNDFATLNGKLHKIKIPLFGFGAHDDVILCPSIIPVDEIEQSSQPIMVATSHKGGHVCHLTGNLVPSCWY